VDTKDKIVLFAEELALINSPTIREFADWAVGVLPDYFFTVAASSSGKYHPPYALGNGGLLRHTQAAVRLANTLLTTRTFGDQYTIGQKDAIKVALILHDGLKHGDPMQKHTVKNHPMLIRGYIERKLMEDGFSEASPCPLTMVQREAIYSLIESHMGQWNSADGEKMPKPVTDAQKFIHLCDYLASRKSLDFNFDA